MNSHVFPFLSTLSGQDLNFGGAPPEDSGEEANRKRMQSFYVVDQGVLYLVNWIHNPCRLSYHADAFQFLVLRPDV